MPFPMKLLLHQRYRFGTTSSPTRGCAPEPSRHHTGQKSCVERVFTLPAPAGKGRTRQRKPMQYPASAGTAIAQCVCPGVLLRAPNVNAGRSQQSSPAALRQAPLSRVDEVEFGSATIFTRLAFLSPSASMKPSVSETGPELSQGRPKGRQEAPLVGGKRQNATERQPGTQIACMVFVSGTSANSRRASAAPNDA